MPVLIGGQGEGKSTFFKYLSCNDAWYDDNFNFKNLDNKAVIESMSGRWILEMGEMDTLKKDAVTADALKALIAEKTLAIPLIGLIGYSATLEVLLFTETDIRAFTFFFIAGILST